MIKDFPWPALSLTLLLGLWGLNWGLPSKERAALFLKPEMRNEAFYQKLEKHRDQTYEKIGLNPIAHYGRQARVGKLYNDSLNLLAAYSGFLLRTHHGDEQQVLVMLSRINPFQGRWYPYTFQYGGAYVFPLGAYLKTLQTLGLIKLVSQVSFYYAHPDEMGKVYYAVRGWSVLAAMCAVIPLFFLALPWVGRTGAHFASCLFALLPACIGNAKLAKPHMWAAVGSLGLIYFATRAKEDISWKPLLLAACCFGWAVGTTLSQAAYLPFLVWACWSKSVRETALRLLVAGALSVGIFTITNFYIFAHFQDFRDELFLFRTFYPFGITWCSLGDFFYKASHLSMGYLPWALAGGGFVYALFKQRETPLGRVAFLSLCVSIFFAFQNQSQLGSPVMSRLFLGLLGVGCIFASVFIFQVLSTPWIGALSLLVALGGATLYDLHYASDRVPKDNASLAAQWVQSNVPPGSVIAQDQALPQTFGFPPIDFSAYRILQIGSPAFHNVKGRAFAILPLWAVKEREQLLQNGYTLVERFAQSPLQKWGQSDAFTTANFPLEIYTRK